MSYKTVFLLFELISSSLLSVNYLLEDVCVCVCSVSQEQSLLWHISCGGQFCHYFLPDSTVFNDKQLENLKSHSKYLYLLTVIFQYSNLTRSIRICCDSDSVQFIYNNCTFKRNKNGQTCASFFTSVTVCVPLRMELSSSESVIWDADDTALL